MSELSDMVSKWLKKGYSLDYVKKYLQEYGYGTKEIEDAMKEAQFLGQQTIRHEHSISKSAVFFLLLMIFASAGAIFAVLTLTGISGKEALLDLEVEPLKNNFNPGERVDYTLRILNLGDKERFDVEMEYELVDTNSKSYGVQSETFALSTSSSRDKNIVAPEKPGTYALKAIASYDGKQATASFTFSVEEEKKEEPKEEKPDYSSIIKEVETLSTTQPSEAEKQCLEVNDDDSKDDCLSIVVKESRRPEFCNSIVSDETRDSCYMSFIVEGQNYLCEQVVLENSLNYCERVRDVQLLAGYYNN